MLGRGSTTEPCFYPGILLVLLLFGFGVFFFFCLFFFSEDSKIGNKND